MADDEFSMNGAVFDEEELAEYEPSDVEAAEDPTLQKVGDTKGLWDDDDFAAIEQQKDAKAAEDEEGNTEVQTDFLYYTSNLSRGRAGSMFSRRYKKWCYNFGVNTFLQFESMQIELMNFARRPSVNGPWTITSCSLVQRDKHPNPTGQQKGQSVFLRVALVHYYDLQDWGRSTGQQLWLLQRTANEKSV